MKRRTLQAQERAAKKAAREAAGWKSPPQQPKREAEPHPEEEVRLRLDEREGFQR